MRIFAISLSERTLTFFGKTRLPPIPRVSAGKASHLDNLKYLVSVKWPQDVTKVYLSWGNEPNGLKRRIFDGVQVLLAVIPEEEWFLKTIGSFETNSTSCEVLYPSRVSHEFVKQRLTQVVEHGLEYHGKWRKYSILGLPLTVLLSFQPFFPNLPLFYNLFRLYSHQTAFFGALKLESMLLTTIVTYSPSESLNVQPLDKDGMIGLRNAVQEFVQDEKRKEIIGKEFQVHVARAQRQYVENIEVTKGK